LVERDIAALQLRHDLFKRHQRLFKTHFFDCRGLPGYVCLIHALEQ